MVDRLFRERFPDGWSYGVMNDGRVFFIDDIRQRTTWIHPVLGVSIQSGHFLDESLPAGWEMNVDVFGKPYYIDHGSLLTTYTHPRFQDSPVYSPPESRVPAENSNAFPDKRMNIRKSFSRRKSLSDPPTARRDPVTSIVKQGWLHKQESGFLKAWKRRWAVLTNYSLFLYKTPDEIEQNEVFSVILAGYWINPCGKSEKAAQKFAFKVEHKDTKPIYLAAETEEEMWDWLENLTKAAAVPGNQETAESANYEADRLRNKENLFMDDAGISKYSSPYDGNNLTISADDYQNRAMISSNHLNRNPDFSQPHGHPSAFGRVDNYVPQRNSFVPQFSMQEPSATSTPVVNLNNFDWPQRNSSAEGLPNRLTSSQRGLPADRADGRFPGLTQKDFEEVIHDGAKTGPWQPTSHNFYPYGQRHSSPHGFSQNPRLEVDGKLNGGGGQYSFPPSHSTDGSMEFSLSGRQDLPKIWQEPSIPAQNLDSRLTGSRYSHEIIHSDRLFNDDRRFADPNSDRNHLSHSHTFNPAMQSSEEGDYSPPRPPVPGVLRNLYIDDLAATKTPHSRQDILQAKELSERRLNEPNVFQFPESPPKQQVSNPFMYSNDLKRPESHYAEVSRHQSQWKTNPSKANQNQVHQREPVVFNPHGQTPHAFESRLSKSSDKLQPTDNSLLMPNDIADDTWKGKQTKNGPYNSGLYASVSPKISQKHAAASRAIEPIKEDPNMSDTDVLNTRTLQDMQKHMLGHTRLRLSISVRDLVGKSQEELVLLLIQLRRSQSKLEELLSWARNRLSTARPQEKVYKLERKNSIGRLEDALEHGHEYFVQLQKQADEIEKQIDVTQPLINLLDNIVTMGSLYNGDGLMYASQYKKGQLHPDQVVPTKKMLEFSRINQEVRLASKQEQSLQQLTDDEVDLEEKLQQLYALDADLQDHSNAVTSLQEDKAMLEKMLDEIKASEKIEADQYTLQHIVKQRQMCEKNLLSVRQNLADASKRLEETNAENARVEQQVVLLRNKIHGGLVKSQSTPSLMSNSGREALKMEEELKSMKTTMENLASQGTKIFEAMESLKSFQPGTKAPAAASSTTSGYMETDLDTKVSRDISVRLGANNKMGSYWPADSSHKSGNYGSVNSSQNVYFPSSSSMSRLPNDQARIEYRFITPPLVHQSGPNTSSQPLTQHGIRPQNLFYIQQGNPHYHSSSSGSWRNYNDANQRNSQNNHFEQHGQTRQQSHGNTYGVRGPNASFDEINRRPYGNSSKDQLYPVSVRDVKKREMSRRNPGDYQVDDDTRYSVLQRSRSLPRVNVINANAGFQDYGRQSLNEKARRKSSVYLPTMPPKDKIESSARERLFPPNEHSDQINRHPSASYQAELKRSQSIGTISNFENRSQNRSEDRFAGGAQWDQRPQFKSQAAMGPSVGKMHLAPSFSKSENSQRSIFTTYDPTVIHNTYMGESNQTNTKVPDTEVSLFDDSTIDKALFQRPQPVEIPERYIPDSSDEDESLSLEERLLRKEKADQFKKIIAKQSLQDFSQGELTLQTGPVHHQLNDETRRRERILDVKRSLAQEVMLRSKEDAALRRKDWSTPGMAYAQNGLSNVR